MSAKRLLGSNRERGCRSRTDKVGLSRIEVKEPLSVTPRKALQEAIRHAGSQAALAKSLGVSKQAVQVWEIAPVRHVLKIEKLTGIPRRTLRPDVYPD
jgi:hypothetical protein